MIPCPFEQAHGRPCLICRDGSGLFPAEHPDHLLIGEDADRRAARDLYQERGLYLEPAAVKALTRDERASWDAWAASPGPGIPARSHVAGPFSPDGRQACTRCGVVLCDGDVPFEPDYPVGAFVGLDCEGTPA